MALKPEYQKIADTHPDAADLIHAMQDLLDNTPNIYGEDPSPHIDDFQRAADRYFQFLWDQYDEIHSADPFDYLYEEMKNDL